MGRIWIDRLRPKELSDTGERLSPADGERIVRPCRSPCRRRGPLKRASRPSCPRRGEVRGFAAAVVAARLAIRKPAVAVFTLDDYVAARIMSPGQAEALQRCRHPRQHPFVAGGT